MDPFLGEIRAFAFGRIPRGWALCNGAILAIQTNQALFALLGIQYGGNGSTTFGLPDLRGRAPLGFSTIFPMGLPNGSESVTLTLNEIPQHTHQLQCNGTTTATTNVPSGAAMAPAANSLPVYGAPTTATLAADAVALTGAGLPHQNMQPSLVVNWCIATQGIYPPRP
jgi:microcystin-dependent protein